MPEPITTVGLGAIAAYLGKDGLQKLLGPTADYLGEGLRDFTQRRVENIGHIFRNAQSKLGDRIEAPGEVPPKVLKEVLDEGSFSNDILTVEYFGGILASSKTKQGRDDRGARVAKILDGLSTYQVRTHYLIYSTMRELFKDDGLIFTDRFSGHISHGAIFIPTAGYIEAMDFSETELAQGAELLRHVFYGLQSDGLIERYGYRQQRDNHSCAPTVLGAELFLWAFGHGDKPLEFITDANFFSTIEGVPKQFRNASRMY